MEDKNVHDQAYEKALRKILELEKRLTLDVEEKRVLLGRTKRLAEGFYLLQGKGVGA